MTTEPHPRLEVRGPHAPLGIEIDRTGTALYVRASEESVARTEEIEDGVLGDFDAKGRLVGFEIIGLERGRVAVHGHAR